MSSKTTKIYDESYDVWNPNKVDLFRSMGIEIAMGDRSSCTFKDLEGNEYINMHSNGGVFNLGHKNQEIKEALIEGLELVDAGNHYFPSQYKNDLCKALLNVSPDNMKYVFLLNGGGEAIDASIKFARKATKRKRVISLNCSFHGATGLALQAGTHGLSEFFNMKPNEDEFTHVEYNNLEQLETLLKNNDTACVLIETIPATAGFPLPIDGYHKSVQALSHKYGALYIADEVQTGLLRSGEMWCASKYGAKPDMIVTGKGLSGGIYPMSAVIMSEEAGAWLKEDGFAHVSSFNATELGCIVSSKVMEILARPSTQENVAMLTDTFDVGIEKLRKQYPEFIEENRQCGVIMGIKTAHPKGGQALMVALIRNGVWCVRANFDHSVLQFKPGLLMSKDVALDVLVRLEKSIPEAIASLK